LVREPELATVAVLMLLQADRLKRIAERRKDYGSLYHNQEEFSSTFAFSTFRRANAWSDTFPTLQIKQENRTDRPKFESRLGHH
jgi:hypothetical protein